ncbi:MAG: hypothetical protein N2516_02435 [Dictyoglomaceae bacterium]|nr:hypothetical protein [Dictyoglomaceae bacterium]
MKIKLIILLTLIFLLVPVYTLAVEVSEESLFPLAKDPRALGMAGAMTALGDSPTSAIFNPALMGEYNSFSLKVGLGFWPVDDTVWNNFNKIMEYIDMLNKGIVPQNDNLTANTYLTGYAHLGIGRFGLTLYGDTYPYFEFNKGESYGKAQLNSPFNINGALTLSLPIIDLRNLKFNIGANFRVNLNGYVENTYSYEQSGSNTFYFEDREAIYKYWTIDLGAWLKLSDNLAVGLSANNIYAQGIEGDIHHHIKDLNTGYVYTYPVVYIPAEDIILPPLTLKAGALLKLPVLSTRIAFDVDLDKNFQPTLYKLGIEQPLLFLTVRGGAILDTNFQPEYFTVGAGINLLFLRVDAGLGYQAEGSFMETIQNTMPLVASFSGSIQF